MNKIDITLIKCLKGQGWKVTLCVQILKWLTHSADQSLTKGRYRAAPAAKIATKKDLKNIVQTLIPHPGAYTYYRFIEKRADYWFWGKNIGFL